MTEAQSTERIDGRAINIWVDTESGQWGAHVGGENIAHGRTREEVVKKARAALRRKKVRLSIPATIIDVEGDSQPFDVIVTGLHAQNDDILYELAGGLAGAKEKGRMSTSSWHRRGELCERLTADELTNFVELRKMAQRATAALEKWRRLHVMSDSEQFVKDAIEAEVGS